MTGHPNAPGPQGAAQSAAGGEVGPRVPPSNIEAEQAVLGALLLHNEVVEHVGGLEPEHFFDAVHGRLFSMARRMIVRGMLVSPVTMKRFMAPDPGLKALGGPEYIAKLSASVVSILACGEYAAEIRRLHHLREALRLIDEAQAKLETMEPEGSISDVGTELAGELMSIDAQSGSDGEVHSLSSTLAAALNVTHQGFQRDGEARFPTGLERLDEMTGGFKPGRLYFILGSTSMGKTGLGLHMAYSLVRDANPDAGIPARGVPFFSFEMVKEDIGHRVISMVLARGGRRIPYNRLSDGRLGEDEFRASIEASREIEHRSFLTMDGGTRTLPRLAAAVQRSRRLMDRAGVEPGPLFVDYLQLIGPGLSRVMPRVEQVMTVSRGLHDMAKELHMPIVCLAQATRDLGQRKDRRPTVHDIAWSSEAEQAADCVIGVYRPAKDLQDEAKREADPARRSELFMEATSREHDMELLLLKNRGGPLGEMTVWCDIATNHIADRAPGTPAAGDDQEKLEGFA